MDKQLTFQEFKQRYEALTINNGFGRIASDEELYKMYVAACVIKQFEKEDSVEKEKDFKGRN